MLSRYRNSMGGRQYSIALVPPGQGASLTAILTMVKGKPEWMLSGFIHVGRMCELFISVVPRARVRTLLDAAKEEACTRCNS